jgi:hypothetical protein
VRGFKESSLGEMAEINSYQCLDMNRVVTVVTCLWYANTTRKVSNKYYSMKRPQDTERKEIPAMKFSGSTTIESALRVYSGRYLIRTFETFSERLSHEDTILSR